MLWLDLVRLALRNLAHRRTRSWLTIVGVLIGITAVVALITLGQSMQRAIRRAFSDLGYDVIVVGPKHATGGFLKMEDLASFTADPDTIAHVDGVSEIGLIYYQNLYVQAKGMEGFLRAFGISANIPAFLGLRIVSGRPLREGDKGVVLIGESLAQDFGLGVGDKILLEEKPFTVAGIYRPGDRMQGKGESLLLPLEDLWGITGEREYSLLLIRAAPGHPVATVAQRIEETLRRTRRKDDLEAQTMEEVYEVVQRSLGILGAFLGGIAGISLLVGGIGVMNTMYTAVLERTREIGVMKAVGASERQIMWLFLVESGLMGTVGGAIGTALGIALDGATVFVTKRVLQADILEFGVSWWVVLGALGFSFLVGSISGLLPARAAAKLDPVRALRYE